MVARQTQIRRPLRRRTNWLAWGCGCLAVVGVLGVVAVVGVILLLPGLPGLAASFAGLTAEGATDNVFVDNTPPPPVQLQNAQVPEQVTVNLGNYGGDQAITTDSGLVDVQVGSDTSGQQTALVSFTEQGILDLCRQRSEICSGADPRFQNARLDLRPGGAVIYADVTVPTQFGFTVQQPAGVVLQLDPSARQFQFAGIDLQGQLYTNPPAEFASYVQQFESTGNDILNELSINAGAGAMQLSQVQIDDSTLTLVMR